MDNTSNPANFLKMASWNIHGVNSRKHELGEIAHRHDLNVIALETFLSEGKKFTFGDYEVYRQHRRAREGGSAILVKKGLKHLQLTTPADFQWTEAVGGNIHQ